MRIRLFLFIGLALHCWCAPVAAQQRFCVHSDQSVFRIFVGTGGLFGVFAHDHIVEASKIIGCATIDRTAVSRSSVELRFPTSELHVVDPKISEKDRAEIQQQMETTVLDVAQYPEVVFRSTGVEPYASPGTLRITGDLTIRNSAKPVTVSIKTSELGNGEYRVAGEYRFKQTSFGIKPIQIAAGTVKVKDELRVEFDLHLRGE
jgi:polyisoprenoid-binding protein YceI